MGKWQEMLLGYQEKIIEGNLPAANEELFEQFGLEVKVEYWGDKPKEKIPWIVVGMNHESPLEPFGVAEVIGGRKFAAFGNYGLTQLVDLPEVLIPVVPRRFAVDRRMTIRRWGERLADQFRPLNKLIRDERLTLAEIEKINNQAFERGVEVLKKGGVIVIFPTGGGASNKPWARGLGEVIMKAIESGVEEAVIIPVVVEGVNKFDLWVRLNYFLATGRAVARPLRLKVTVGKPVTFEEVERRLGSLSPAEIMSWLEIELRRRSRIAEASQDRSR